MVAGTPVAERTVWGETVESEAEGTDLVEAWSCDIRSQNSRFRTHTLYARFLDRRRHMSRLGRSFRRSCKIWFLHMSFGTAHPVAQGDAVVGWLAPRAARRATRRARSRLCAKLRPVVGRVSSCPREVGSGHVGPCPKTTSDRQGKVAGRMGCRS